jgi:hypothetical protein
LTLSVEELLALFASPAVETLAVLLMGPVAEPLTPTTRGMVDATVPGPMGPGFVQVTT